MSCAECIPLFPTQPLLLASGLLFGTRTGALCILAANFLAGTATFFIARGVGRPWAERLMGADTTSPLAQRAQQLRAVIERGRFWQQAGTILLLRMTPIVPFRQGHGGLGRGMQEARGPMLGSDALLNRKGAGGSSSSMEGPVRCRLAPRAGCHSSS